MSLLVQAASSCFAVPLAVRIHEGLVWSNRDRRTLLDKMLALLGIAGVEQPFYFVADAYYAAQKIVAGLLAQNNHLVTRMKSNAVAYTVYQQRGPRQRGRPRLYGRKLKLGSLLQASRHFHQAPSPVYGETKVVIQYRVRDLLWRPAGRLVRFVAVIHPTRGACLLMCTDTSLDAIDIIRLYGLRFKIEHSFKQAVRQIGSFTYHFWMADMKPLRRNNGNQHLHRSSLDYRNTVKRKLHAYHVFIQAAEYMSGVSREEQHRVAAADIGFIGQNVYLYCASEGLACVFRASLDAERLARYLGVGRNAVHHVLADGGVSEGVVVDLAPLPVPPQTRAEQRNRQRWWLIGTALLLLSVVASAAWWAAHRETPIHYTTAPATRGAVTRTVTATGTVNPVLTIIVGSYVSGVIRQLLCDYNTQVKRGQVCAKIDPRPYQAALDQYSGQLARDRAILDKDRSDLVRYQTLTAHNFIARQQAEDKPMSCSRTRGP